MFSNFLRTIILKNICERLLLNIFKKRLELRYFLVNFVNYSRTPFSRRSTNGLLSNPSERSFNKIASLAAWKLLTVLEKDCRTGISLWILRNFWESFFCRTPPSNHFSHDVVFSFLQISEVCSLKSIQVTATGLKPRTTSFVNELEWVFVYELSGSGFESSCCHLNFRFRPCFEQGVPWDSGK